MFKRIGIIIALQFTGFVFLLLLITGLLFLVADFGRARRDMTFRLEREGQMVVQQMEQGMKGFALRLPPPLRARVRILGTDGQVLYAGEMFTDVQPSLRLGLSREFIQEEQYAVLTAPLIATDGSGVRGYMQVAEIERLPGADIPKRMLLYLLLSVGVSALTFGIGHFFARRSLRPAEETMRRLEQFTQDASHELRTPIAAIASSLDLALKTRKYEEGIRSAKEDLRDITVLVERLLELTRLDALTMEKQSVDLSSLVRSAVEKHGPAARERGVEIVTKIAENISVQGDATLLRQMVGNLLGNAIKFSKDNGGTVTVSLTPQALSVADEGIGIAPDMLPQIFRRFFQADASRSRHGLGLGLALVKRIVDLHGWTVAAESEQGKGTIFTVRFG